MKQKIFLIFAPVALMLLIVLIICISLTPNNIAYASDGISPYTIEQGFIYYLPYCDIDNGFIPKLPVAIEKDVNGREINDTGVHMDLVRKNNNNIYTSSYERPKQYLRYNHYTHAYSQDNNYIHNVTLWGAENAFDFRLYTNDDIVDDSYSGYIHGVGNAKQRIGKSALFYRIKESATGEWTQWTHVYNLFGSSNSVYLNFAITSPCDIEMVNVYELKATKSRKDYYYNLRQEFEIHFRNEADKLVIVEDGTNTTLSSTSNSISYTDKGFKILNDPFKTISIKKDNGNYMTNSELDKLSFVENGVYQIKYTQDGTTYNQTVVVDQSEPSINIGGEVCSSAYDKLLKINGITYQCFNSKNAVALTWTNNTNKVPITVSKLENGEYKPIENGERLNLGNYIIKVSKHYTRETISRGYNIIIDNFLPNYNHELLRNGESYTNRPNRFSTRYYGVKINNVNYGYATQQAALEKGLEYERANFVTQNGSNFQYRGKTYTSNLSLTSAMNAYVKANYYFENRDLKSGAQTVLQSELKDNRLYLNGFKFEYNSNPVYSNSVRVLKATDKYPNLDADVKSILRDTSNKSVVNIMYEKTVDSQLSAGGKYYIRETNVFGNEYFYEAYYVANNETSASISYYDTNGILKNGSITSGSANISGVTSLHISKITNELDQYATIKITKDGKTVKILVVGDEYTLTEAGTYTLLFIDRNGKEFTKSVTITNPNFVLNGVVNSGTANNDVTISLKGGYEIEMFVVGGEIISGEVFKLNSKTQRYEYTVQQDKTEKDVVLILKYGNDTINIGFTINAKA